jgi:hypothetical protein
LRTLRTNRCVEKRPIFSSFISLRTLAKTMGVWHLTQTFKTHGVRQPALFCLRAPPRCHPSRSGGSAFRFPLLLFVGARL